LALVFALAFFVRPVASPPASAAPFIAPVAAPFVAATSTSPTTFFALSRRPFAKLLPDFFFELFFAALEDLEAVFFDEADFEDLDVPCFFFVAFLVAMFFPPGYLNGRCAG
jgi:hypothetical protein